MKTASSLPVHPARHASIISPPGGFVGVIFYLPLYLCFYSTRLGIIPVNLCHHLFFVYALSLPQGKRQYVPHCFYLGAKYIFLSNAAVFSLFIAL
jgi:hypothetical protein